MIAPFASKSVFSATELERFADCSSAWLVERVIDPKKIDAGPDPILRGSVMPTPSPHDVRRLSYSAIALFDRCSYRYFAERVLGLPRREAFRGDSVGELAATEIGDAVHRLLELVPLDEPVAPSSDDLEHLVRGWYPEVSSAELDRIAELVRASCESELAKRIARLGGARPERPFAFEHEGVVIRGRLDVLWREGDRALVVDYKSNVLEGRAPEEIIESDYTLQRLVYALVCLRAGATDVEVAYQLLEQPHDVVSKTFTPTDAQALESELSAAIARIRAGEFRPTPSEFACHGRPACLSRIRRCFGRWTARVPGRTCRRCAV